MARHFTGQGSSSILCRNALRVSLHSEGVNDFSWADYVRSSIEEDYFRRGQSFNENKSLGTGFPFHFQPGRTNWHNAIYTTDPFSLFPFFPKDRKSILYSSLNTLGPFLLAPALRFFLCPLSKATALA